MEGHMDLMKVKVVDLIGCRLDLMTAGLGVQAFDKDIRLRHKVLIRQTGRAAQAETVMELTAVILPALIEVEVLFVFSPKSFLTGQFKIPRREFRIILRIFGRC
jgi:hypothetical protein